MERIFTKKDLAKLILPLVAELLLTLLVGMIDSAMVSSAGESAVSGVSLVDTVFQLLIYIFSAFATGGAVAAGQYLGARQPEKARETADQLVRFSAVVSLGIMAIVYLVRGFLLGTVFGAITPEVYRNANVYLLITALSIPALSVYESGAAIFRTMGNSQITMILSAIMNAVNICGNAILIYGFQLGAAGAAAATVAARYTAAAVMVLKLLRADQPLCLAKSWRFVPNKSLIRHILQIGVPNGVENGLFQVGKIILAGLFTRFGTAAIAANAVCQAVSNIEVIPGGAVSLATTTVIARCVGACDEKQARYYNRHLIRTAYAAVAVFCAVCWFALPGILPWYHLSEQTADLTTRMVLVHTLGAVTVWPLAFIVPSSLRAAGDVRFAMVASVFSMFVFRLGTAYLFALNLGMGAVGIWCAMVCDWTFRGIVFGLRWLSGKWKNKGILQRA